MAQEPGASRSKIKRKPRMNPVEVRRRALATAEQMVLTDGLMVSMDHISLEEIIVRAQVSRSAVHRMWPRKEDFFADLLVQLADRSDVSPSVFDPQSLAVAMAALRAQIDQLVTPEGRLAVLVEICRQGAIRNFEANLIEESWHAFVVLSATGMSFDDEVRATLGAKLAASERNYVDGMAQFYSLLLPILGRRIRPQFGGQALNLPSDYLYLAEVCSSAIQGQVLRAGITGGDLLPDLRMPTADADPFGTGLAKPWTGPALTFTSTMVAMTEPIRDYVFDRDETERQVTVAIEYVENARTARDSDGVEPVPE
ncbi:hypothetical protein GII30_05260 [Gordonia amarae]|uniref:Uncharacterized protein n=2 Tax=Gordonia amarae TaxID=36821 RepID=A0A857KUQ2_9ACTN|nr:hypothetical protein [Gordonia amarae]MCS3877777.1 AcrR family transcriptional regulator [Gordonia amarae]QHN16472.1 hypothetical protein GII35_05265 [Gordonia amarae]QHN21041.1 hypothetical protein GII34_05265 [Gordonia amarae]QHN29893.1 hypothetical protein GII32_05275 [Gordonia amarae]QHN38668.1 hypothetical protein GII30_05260 [Gordonia amarae]